MSFNDNPFNAEEYLIQRGWLPEIAGDDFPLGIKILNSVRDSKKGLILSGTYGCGKSAFVSAAFGEVMKMFTMPQDEWILGESLDARDLSSESIILDDIGSEHQAYVNCIKVEPFADFVMRHYSMPSVGRLVITTNHSITEFDGKYGGRVVSRLKEMCYAAHFNGKDKRKWDTIK